MKKKLTEGQKKEARLRFRYQELKRAGKIKKHTSFNEFRNSEFNAFVTREVQIVVGKGKNTRTLTRKQKRYVSLAALTEAKDKTFPAEKQAKVIVTKSERREARRHLKHVILKMIQEAAALRKEQKKLNRELRIAHAQERRDLKARQELEKVQLHAKAA